MKPGLEYPGCPTLLFMNLGEYLVSNCKYCSLELSNRRNQFCTQSCAAKYNNRARESRSAESRYKTKMSLDLYYKNNKICKSRVYLLQCVVCNNKFYSGNHRKTCNNICLLAHQRIVGSKNLKNRHADPNKAKNIGRANQVI